MTATTRSFSPPAWCGATLRFCARTRAFSGKSACRTRRITCGRRCASTPAWPRISSSFSTRASTRISAPQGRARCPAKPQSQQRSKRLCRRSRASTRIVSCAFSSTPSQAAMRTNFYQRDRDGKPKDLIADQVRQPQTRRHAAAAAALRNLRLFAARRGRASALRQGGARRHPLVRPAAGFPHRDPRPGQGAERQERGHRAGRRQRRLRAQAPAERRRRARRSRPKGIATYKLFISTLLDITDNIGTGTTGDRSAGRRGAPRRRRSLSGGRRRQGHRDLLRHRQRDRRSSTASGWATPSPPAARPATTTRRWASPRAAPGNRSSAISARWTSTSRRRRSPCVGVGDMSGDVFGNGMLREKTIKLVAAFDHRDIFIDPDPDPERSLRRAPAPVRSAAFELAGLRQDADLQGRRRLSRAAPRKSGFRRRRRSCSASANAVTPQELIRAILKAQVDLLFFGGIGTYVRAADETDEAAGDRANDAHPRHRQGAALQGDRRGRQSRHDPARPHRGGVRAASGSTPTPSTIRPASTPPTWRSTSRSR